MAVQEVEIGGGQRARFHEPAVTDLTCGQAHEGSVAVLPPRWRQQPAHLLAQFALDWGFRPPRGTGQPSSQRGWTLEERGCVVVIWSVSLDLKCQTFEP
jgi:hypothetical protein